MFYFRVVVHIVHRIPILIHILQNPILHRLKYVHAEAITGFNPTLHYSKIEKFPIDYYVANVQFERRELSIAERSGIAVKCTNPSEIPGKSETNSAETLRVSLLYDFLNN